MIEGRIDVFLLYISLSGNALPRQGLFPVLSSHPSGVFFAGNGMDGVMECAFDSVYISLLSSVSFHKRVLGSWCSKSFEIVDTWHH